jgi:hypothetical protein
LPRGWDGSVSFGSRRTVGLSLLGRKSGLRFSLERGLAGRSPPPHQPHCRRFDGVSGNHRSVGPDHVLTLTAALGYDHAPKSIFIVVSGLDHIVKIGAVQERGKNFAHWRRAEVHRHPF